MTEHRMALLSSFSSESSFTRTSTEVLNDVEHFLGNCVFSGGQVEVMFDPSCHLLAPACNDLPCFGFKSADFFVGLPVHCLMPLLNVL